MRALTKFCCVAMLAAGSAARADAGHEHGGASGVGAPARASEATRTVDIAMTEFGYRPPSIDVRADETVRFRISNEGRLVHEFNIGTRRMHEAHQAEMLEMLRSGGMSQTEIHTHGEKAHAHANSVLLEPGTSGEIVWRFGEDIESLEFACNVPGHYQAGMVGAFKRR